VYSSPTIADCVITGNASLYDNGGGVYTDHSDIVLSRCVIQNNFAHGGGGGGGVL
jgi:hypothetical protein